MMKNFVSLLKNLLQLLWEEIEDLEKYLEKEDKEGGENGEKKE